jgi:sugar lactone lactonase YvrE
MKSRWISLVVFLSFITLFLSLAPKTVPDSVRSLAWGQGYELPFPKDATFTTLTTTPRAIEGLTGDNYSNLYTGGSGSAPCPIWKINLASPSPLVEIGTIPTSVASACNLAGIAFNDIGDLFIADLAVGRIYVLRRNSNEAEVYASGAPGANGLAFDKKGNLWVSDGTTGQGRVWKIAPGGGVCEDAANPYQGCEEVFRIQPMSNEVNLVEGVGGVGRDVRTLPPGTITVTPLTRNAANQLGSQPLVANGLAFNEDGDKLFIGDTARGAIWKATFNRDGHLRSKTGCDTTFTPNTLCLDNIFVAHAFLEGADGIALDQAGNIWVAANERQAVVVVTKEGKVIEVFRNPVNSPTGVGLRNAGDQSVGNDHILEFPTSPFLIGNRFCTASSDGNRRDNSPNTAGEIQPNSPAVGKISCMDQELIIPGLRLPIE